MKRHNRLLTILLPIPAILTLSSCAQQGEIKEPFEIERHLDSSDYKGEIHPFKEPVVIRRLPYEQRSTTTTRTNNKAGSPTVSTMTIMRGSQRVKYPEEQLAATTFWILGGESKSSTEPSTEWQYHMKFSFTLDLSDFSISDKVYPVLWSTKEEQRQIAIIFDWLLDTVRELRGLGNAYFDQPISAENNEFVFEHPLTTPKFDTLLNFKGKLTAVGMTTYLSYDAIVMEMSGTTTGSNDALGQVSGYSVLSARDGVTLFSKLVGHSYQGSEHGRLLREMETTIVTDNYHPTPTSTDVPALTGPGLGLVYADPMCYGVCATLRCS